MKKILIGICGIGNGHINRQMCVIKELKKLKCKIVVAVDKSKIDTLSKLINKKDIIPISIPWIVCDENGFNFKETLKKHNSDDLFKNFLEFGIEVEKKIGGKPDLVISDYEPNVASYAYAQNVPIITMEQQSKFLYIKEKKIKDYSIKEEKYRIGYFFPKYDKKIISSFFPIKIKDSNIIQVSPIIPNMTCKDKNTNVVVVYFSPYSDSDKYEKVLKIIQQIDNYKFKVYTKNSMQYKEFEHGNIMISDFNENFKKDLASSSAVISTCGHQLISEAIALDKPLYLLPLETYEQNYNGLMVAKYKLGTNKPITLKRLELFLKNLHKYENNIKSYKKKYYTKKWNKVLIDIIKKY